MINNVTASNLEKAKIGDLTLHQTHEEAMQEDLIYIATVDGKVSHVYSPKPLSYRVVAMSSEDPQSIRISSETRDSTETDKLVVELMHLIRKEPYSEDLLHGKGSQLKR